MSYFTENIHMLFVHCSVLYCIKIFVLWYTIWLDQIQIQFLILTHFRAMLHFITPWKARKPGVIWGKVFKDGLSKMCGRQSLKNLKWYGLPQQTISLQIFWRLSSTYLTWFILVYFASSVLRGHRNGTLAWNGLNTVPNLRNEINEVNVFKIKRILTPEHLYWNQNDVIIW